MEDLTKDIRFLVLSSQVGKYNPVVVRFRTHRKINIAMELAALGLKKIKRAIAIAPVKLIGIFDRLIVRIEISGRDRTREKLFVQENCESLRKAISSVLNNIHII